MSRQWQNMLKSHQISTAVIDNKKIVRDIGKQVVQLKKKVVVLKAQLMELIHGQANLAKK
jgi:hypothetical protein